MSDETYKDSESQRGRTAKTPDLIGFSTADKLSYFDEKEVQISAEKGTKKRSTNQHPIQHTPPLLPNQQQ